MDYWKTPECYYSYLYFFELFKDGATPEQWKRAKEETVNNLIKIVEQHLVGSEPEYPYDDHTYSLRWGYALFRLLAIIISEEFDAILDAIPSGNVDRGQVVVLQTVSRLWEEVGNFYGLAPVRLFDLKEKKLFCTPGPEETMWARHHMESRVLISFDPYLTPEDAAEAVKNIFKQWQRERFSEDKASWLADGFSDEQAEELATKDRLHGDHPRSPKTGKRPRSNRETTFPLWLRVLRVYRAVRKGETSTAICESSWWNLGRENSSQVSKDGKKARILIKLALEHEPLSLMKTNI